MIRSIMKGKHLPTLLAIILYNQLRLYFHGNTESTPIKTMQDKHLKIPWIVQLVQ